MTTSIPDGLKEEAMHWYYDGAGWVGWLVMVLLMLLFLGVLVAIAVAVTKRFTALSPPESRRDSAGTGADSAENLLASRFAKGEIDEEEYLKRRGILRG
jgi:putative membrane protein